MQHPFPALDVPPAVRHVIGVDLGKTIARLRSRARLLRIQAIAALLTLVLSAVAIGWIFISLHKLAEARVEISEARAPYDYRLMETRHEELANRLKDMAETLTDAKQELISDKYGSGGANHMAIAKLLQTRADELTALRADVDARVSKDRQNLYLEINQLKTERDEARTEGAERRSFIKLVGDAVMRVGVLVLAMYLIAILSSIAKYWLRVADHLNSVADSLDLLSGAGLDLGSAIAALTPHAIDFHVEDISPPKSLSDLMTTLTPSLKKSG